jgi:hypothetical protein
MAGRVSSVDDALLSCPPPLLTGYPDIRLAQLSPHKGAKPGGINWETDWEQKDALGGEQMLDMVVVPGPQAQALGQATGAGFWGWPGWVWGYRFGALGLGWVGLCATGSGLRLVGHSGGAGPTDTGAGPGHRCWALGWVGWQDVQLEVVDASEHHRVSCYKQHIVGGQFRHAGSTVCRCDKASWHFAASVTDASVAATCAPCRRWCCCAAVPEEGGPCVWPGWWGAAGRVRSQQL